MKKILKRSLCIILAISFVLALTGCAKIGYVTNGTIKSIKEVQDGTWNQQDDAAADGTEDATVIDEFVANTYGGIEMKTQEDAINYYVQCYNYTKGLTAEYKAEDGTTQTWYKLLGSEELSIDKVLIEGSENSVINKLVPGIVSGLWSPNIYGLPPCNNRNPELDVYEGNENCTKEGCNLTQTYFTPEDCKACNVKDNGDGTITMTIQPKQAEMSMRGADPQGNFFEVLGDIGSTVKSISVLSFSQGTADENVKVIYAGGTGTVTIDTATGEITSADYIMKVKVNVSHATVTVIKDKSAAVEISYENKYPADDAYLMSAKGASRL